MPLILGSPEDLINAAFSKLGYRRRVGSVYDGTEASVMALDLYGQTRDALLREKDFDFSAKIAAGTTSGSAPFPWKYQFTYPTDCLKVRAIFDPAYDLNFPLPVNWQVGSSAGNRVLWANLPAISINYTFQATDPLQWEPMFTEALIDKLAEKFVLGLSSLDAEKVEQPEAQASVQMADARDG